ncbi:MAG: choice-of-anchor L domain-containing protein [Bacteroidales bacterium]
MKKTFISFVLIISTMFVVAQSQISQDNAELTTNPEETVLMKPANDLQFHEFILNPDSNVELPQEENFRHYYNQNYYFSFTMPENKDVDVFLKYPDIEGVKAGLAAYQSGNGTYDIEKTTMLTSSPGLIKVRQTDFQPGEDVLMRLWFSEDMNNQQVSIALKKREPESQPKLITVDNTTYTPQQLVEDVLISGCLEAFNVTYNGDPISVGYFDGSIGTSGFDEGIVLTSGDAEEAAGPDDATSEGTISTGGSDADLQALIPSHSVNDAAILEFDFMPASDTLQFEYIFGSEEFPEFANSSYNDVFGFFLSGPGITGPYSNNAINIALLPNGSPVTIDNVYNNPTYYVGSTSGSGGDGLAYDDDIEYDGATIPLTAEADVTACETYHIKLAIGDAGDSSWDSGVFFKAGSFASGQQYTVNAFNPWYQTDEVYEGCTVNVVFDRLDVSSLDEAIPVPIEVTGDATMGTDYSPIPDTFYIPAGEMSDTLFIEAYTDDIADNGELINFTFDDGCPCDVTSTTYTIEILDELEPDYEVTNTGPICEGESATLNLSLLSGFDLALLDWEWQVNGSTGYSVDVSPTSTTTYELEVFHPCTTFVVETTVEVIPPPDVDLGDDYTAAGYTAELDADPAGDNTGYWEVISGPGSADFDDDSASNTNVTVDSLGVYEFVWTEISLAPDCLDSDTIAIEFFHVPTPDFEIGPVPCYGDTVDVIYTGNAYDWADYDWDFDGGTVISGSGQGPFQVLYDESGNYTISLEIDELGFIVDTSMSFVMPELLEHDLSTEDDPCYQSCNGHAQIVVEGGVMPYDYSWDSGTSENENLCAGDYGITVTDANGCTTGEPFTIDEPAELVYDTTYQNVDCNGNYTGMAEINPSGGTPPYEYNWSNSASTYQLDNINAGEYTVTITDANGCTVSETFTISEPSQLLVSLNQDVEICEGQSVNLQATPIGGAEPYTFFWSDGSGFSQGPASQMVSPDQSTNYSVYVEDAHGCVSPVEDMDITVSPAMSLDLDLTDNTCYNSCDGKAVLTINGGLEPFDFSWPSDTRIYEDICSGLYSVTVVDEIGCTADTVFFIDEPDSIHYNIFSEAATCAGLADGSAWVEVSGGVTPYDYNWSDGSQEDNITAEGGTYTLTISDAHDCRQETEVEIDAPEAVSVYPGNDRTICIGGETTLTAEAMGGTDPYNFTWMGEDSSTGFDHVFTVSPVETTDYFLTVTDDNGCTGQAEMTVNVNPPLTINNVEANQDTVCQNDPITVYVDAEGGNGGPYTLTLQNGDIVPSEFTLHPEESQWWYLTLTDDCGTPAVQDSLFIPVWELPPNNFTSDIVEGCPPLQVQFNELNPDNGYSYHWNFGDEGFGFMKNPAHEYEQEGFYDVSLTVKDTHGCKTKKTINDMIEVFPKPEADFYTKPEQVSVLNPSVQFFAVTENADSLFWYFGDGDSSVWNVNKPVHTYDGLGSFNARLVVENTYGCSDTVNKIVRINDEFTFYAPEVFTPNGDGENDCFAVCGNGIDPNDFYLVVQDRWGETVFETEEFDSDNGCNTCKEGSWDGTFHGNNMKGDERLHGGLFAWYCKFKDVYGNYHEYSGFVRLIR